jgi:hypothetical protein
MLKFRRRLKEGALGGGRLSGTESTVTEAITGLLYQSWMMMYECGSVGGMLSRGN